MREIEYRIKREQINNEDRGFKIVLEGAMLDREGIHIKTEGNTMRTRFIGFRDGNTCEISSRKHCAISRFAIFVDDFQEFDPKVVEGEDDVEEMKK